jgi:hypothetical protein
MNAPARKFSSMLDRNSDVDWCEDAAARLHDVSVLKTTTASKPATSARLSITPSTTPFPLIRRAGRGAGSLQRKKFVQIDGRLKVVSSKALE